MVAYRITESVESSSKGKLLFVSNEIVMEVSFDVKNPKEKSDLRRVFWPQKEISEAATFFLSLQIRIRSDSFSSSLQILI